MGNHFRAGVLESVYLGINPGLAASWVTPGSLSLAISIGLYESEQLTDSVPRPVPGT